MSNDYYNHGGAPAEGSVAASLTMREEFDAISAGFDKMPDLVAGFPVRVNEAGTELESISPAALLAAIDGASVDAENVFTVEQRFDSTVLIGRTEMPSNTTLLVDRLGGGVLPSLASGTIATFVSAAAAGSNGYLQMVSGNAGVCAIRFGDTDSVYRGYLAYDNNGEIMSFGTNGSFAMGINASDYVLMGTQTPVSVTSTTHEGLSYDLTNALAMSRASNPVLSLQRTGSNGSIVVFNKATTNVGGISITGSATTYNTSSDYRLKTDLTPMEDPIAALMMLRPGRFKWLSDMDAGWQMGFLAHEVQAVVPQAVTGKKDAVEDVGRAVRPEFIVRDVREDKKPKGSVWTKTGTTTVQVKVEVGRARKGIKFVRDIPRNETPEGYKWKRTGTKMVDVEVDIGTAVVPESVVENILERETPKGHAWSKTGTRPVHQGIDHSMIVPLLTASLQKAFVELAAANALITKLTKRVTALEKR